MKTSLFSLFAFLAVLAPTFADSSSDTRCTGYCIIQDLGFDSGFYYYEAIKCQNCDQVTLKCSEMKDVDGATCKSCMGSCTGHSVTGCVEDRS